MLDKRQKNHRFFSYDFFPKNHKGLSGVITAVIMIALVLAAAGIVWGVVNNMLKGQMEGAEACFGNYDKVTINSIYTCYDLLVLMTTMFIFL